MHACKTPRHTGVLSGKAGYYRSTLSKTSLKPTALSYHVNMLDPDEQKRRENVSKFKLVIQAAAMLDIPVAITFPGMPISFQTFYPHPPANVERVENAWKNFAAVVGELVDYARSHGILIAVEPYFGYMVYNVKTGERMIKEVPSKNLGFNFDPSHFVWQGFDLDVRYQDLPIEFSMFTPRIRKYLQRSNWLKPITSAIISQCYSSLLYFT